MTPPMALADWKPVHFIYVAGEFPDAMTFRKLGWRNVVTGELREPSIPRALANGRSFRVRVHDDMGNKTA